MEGPQLLAASGVVAVVGLVEECMEIYGCWSGNSNGIESELFEWEKKNGE